MKACLKDDILYMNHEKRLGEIGGAKCIEIIKLYMLILNLNFKLSSVFFK